MPYTIYVTPTAADDLSAAIEYYNSLSTDLGFRFADVIGQYFDRIAVVPTASDIRYKNVRCKPVSRFPFIITYTIDERNKAIQVLRIFNTYQDPKRL